MNHPQNTVRDLIGAMHWATEDLLTQMEAEVMSDEGYAVYRRVVETRERVRKEVYGDKDDTEWDQSPQAGWDDF